MLSVLVEDHDFMCLSTHAAPQNTDTPEKYFWNGFVNKNVYYGKIKVQLY